MIENRYVGREFLSAENLHAASRLESRMVSDITCLLVIFEHRHIDWPGRNPVEPFTVARHDFRRDGPEFGTPVEVLARLNDPDWERFIWLPFEVAHGDCYGFTMRYAHELQHYRQLVDRQSLSKARAFLSDLRRDGFKPTIKSEGNPNEFDADIVALDMFEELHGQSALQAFVSRESESPVMGDFYSRILPLRARFKAKS